MVIQKNVRTIGSLSGTPASDLYGLRVPNGSAPKAPTPTRPPLYLVPPQTPETPSVRISPLWLPVSMILGIVLGPGDTPRATATDIPLSDEVVPNPVDTEKLHQEYLAEIDRLRRKLFNGDIDEWEVSFLRAQIGLLTLLAGALPTETATTPLAAQPAIVNSASVNGSSTPTSDQERSVRDKMKSSNHILQWESWLKLYRLNPEAARQITESDMGPPRSFGIGIRGVDRLMIRMVDDFTMREVLNRLYDHYGQNPWRDAVVDLRVVHPSHSLMEFSPHTTFIHGNGFAYLDKHSYRAEYVNRFNNLLLHTGTEDPQRVLRALVKESVRNDPTQDIYVIQLPSGKQVVLDGHHRIAALVQVIREKGLDPEQWLSRVPVQHWAIGGDFHIPEHLILRFVAPAHELTIDELLPSL